MLRICDRLLRQFIDIVFVKTNETIRIVVFLNIKAWSGLVYVSQYMFLKGVDVSMVAVHVYACLRLSLPPPPPQLILVLLTCLVFTQFSRLFRTPKKFR